MHSRAGPVGCTGAIFFFLLRRVDERGRRKLQAQAAEAVSRVDRVTPFDRRASERMKPRDQITQKALVVQTTSPA